MHNRPRITVVLTSDVRYLRAVYRGVAEYIRQETRPFEVVLVKDLRTLVSQQPRPQGAIVLVSTPAMVRLVSSIGVPIVNVSSRMANTGLPTVEGDDVAVGRVAAEHLLNCGFREFAFQGLTKGDFYSKRGQGFARTVEAAGFKCNFLLRPPSKPHQRIDPAERRRLQRAVAALPKPVGMLSGTDFDAWDVYEVCDSIGLRIGEDIGLVGVDNDEFICETRNPPMSSVDNRPDRIGYEAAALLVRLMRGERPPSQPILVAPLGVVQRQSSDVFAGQDKHIGTAIRFIRDHLNQPLQVQHILGLVPISRRVLERRFQQHLGRTVLEEIHRLKIERIKHLLISTHLTIDEIAAACGFPSASHMATLFRKKSGVTPRVYRSQFRHKPNLR